MARSPFYKGWLYDTANARLTALYNNTARFYIDGTDATSAGALTIDSGGLTVTAGGATITAGNLVVTAGDARVTAGNLRLGAVSAFGTTEPTSAVVMKQGTAPAGAIATSGGIFSNGTVVQKIIAAGTVSNVET